MNATALDALLDDLNHNGPISAYRGARRIPVAAWRDCSAHEVAHVLIANGVTVAVRCFDLPVYLAEHGEPSHVLVDGDFLAWEDA